VSHFNNAVTFTGLWWITLLRASGKVHERS
jgi:hypothetical protein